MRRHVLPLVLVCAISDAVLIAAGVQALAHWFKAILQSLIICDTSARRFWWFTVFARFYRPCAVVRDGTRGG